MSPTMSQSGGQVSSMNAKLQPNIVETMPGGRSRRARTPVEGDEDHYANSEPPDRVHRELGGPADDTADQDGDKREQRGPPLIAHL